MTRIHPKFGTPAFAIITSCAWAAIPALSGTFEQLLTDVVFIGWIFCALEAAAVIVFDTVISQPGQAAIGIGAVRLGAPAYVQWRRRAHIA